MKKRYLSSMFSILMLCLPTTWGCDGSESGNPSNVNNDQDGGVDGSESDQDAWTYECPESQPEGYDCIRGRVVSILDDQPLNVPGGAVIQKFVAATPGEFSNYLESEAEVQEDGRFIFRSTKKTIVHDTGCDEYNNCDDWTYDYFSLRIRDDIEGYIVPDNQYGVVDNVFILNYYLIENTAASSWEEAWWSPGVDTNWCMEGLDLDMDQNYKTVLGICYNNLTDPGFISPSIWYCAEPFPLGAAGARSKNCS